MQNNILIELSYINIDKELLRESKNKSLFSILTETIKSAKGKERQKIESLITKVEHYGLKSLEIVDYTNNNPPNGSGSGFCGIAFKDANGNVGISYRGTENMFVNNKNQSDMIDNILASIFGKSEQIREANEFFQANKDPNGNNYLFGHSKGGNLSLNTYVSNSDEIKKVNVVNAQPLNDYVLTESQRKALLDNEKINATIIEGDIISFIGLPGYLYRLVTFDPSSTEEHEFDDNHSIWSILFDGVNYVDSNRQYYKSEMGAKQLALSAFMSYAVEGIQKWGRDNPEQESHGYHF